MMELKPCPFCGCKAELIPHKFYSPKTKTWEVGNYGVECAVCFASGWQFYENEDNAVKAWNRRAT